MHPSLGKTFRCRITGFTGVATARVEYLTGCNQLHLQLLEQYRSTPTASIPLAVDPQVGLLPLDRMVAA